MSDNDERQFVEAALTLARTTEMSYREAHDALADVAGLFDARKERDRLRSAIDAVNVLHRPVSVATVGGTDTMCAECKNAPRRWDDVSWPCPTAAAVTETREAGRCCPRHHYTCAASFDDSPPVPCCADCSAGTREAGQ